MGADLVRRCVRWARPARAPAPPSRRNPVLPPGPAARRAPSPGRRSRARRKVQSTGGNAGPARARYRLPTPLAEAGLPTSPGTTWRRPDPGGVAVQAVHQAGRRAEVSGHPGRGVGRATRRWLGGEAPLACPPPPRPVLKRIRSGGGGAARSGRSARLRTTSTAVPEGRSARRRRLAAPDEDRAPWSRRRARRLEARALRRASRSTAEW